MTEIVLKYRKPTEIIDIVREMRDNGMIQGVDFDFKYNQAKYEDWSGDYIAPEHTVFIFYNESLASWFTLKYV
jgi:hypothetical protein